MQNILVKIHRHPRATLLVAGIGIFTVSAIVILTMILSLHNNITNPIVTPEEEKKVLSEVIKNNPKNIINPNNTSTTPIVMAPVVPPIVQPEATPNVGNAVPTQPAVAPDLNDYNYRITKTSYNKGPSYELCRPYMHGGGGYGPGYVDSTNTVSEYYEYFERYLTYHKYVSRSDNKLSNYTISKYGRNINTATYYLNGDYAVENTYKPYENFDNQQDKLTVSYPTYTPDELIKQYFGDNAQIIEVQNDANGNKYYIIQSSYDSYCDPSYDPYLVLPEPQPVQSKKIINIYKVNGKTFSIDEIKTYLESISNLNLISTTTTQISRQMVSQNQIANEFSLGSSVTIKKYDYRNLTYSYNPYQTLKDQVDYLKTLDNMYVVLTNPADLLSNIFIPGFVSTNFVDTYAFYKDRTFFPAGDWGTALYESYNKYSEFDMEYSISLANSDNVYYNIARYKTEKTVDEVKSEILDLKSTTKFVEDTIIDFGSGNTVNATKILRSFTRNYPVSYGVSYPTSYTNSSYTYYFTNYVFELAGNVYNITMSSESSEDILMYKEYKIYELTTEEKVQELKDLLVQMHVNYQYRYYYNPVSYPGSYPVSYIYYN